MITTTTSLIDGLKANQPEAIERFKRHYVPVILKFCRDGCKDSKSAEAVTEQVVRVLFRRMKDFSREEGGSFRNYIKTIALSQINDFGRKQNALKKRLERQEFMEQFDRFLLRRVISDLKSDTSIQSKSWEMFFMHYEDKVAVETIADTFGIAAESVKKTLGRIRKKIQTAMDE